jgi:hypothetical protein
LEQVLTKKGQKTKSRKRNKEKTSRQEEEIELKVTNNGKPVNSSN